MRKLRLGGGDLIIVLDDFVIFVGVSSAVGLLVFSAFGLLGLTDVAHATVAHGCGAHFQVR